MSRQKVSPRSRDRIIEVVEAERKRLDERREVLVSEIAERQAELATVEEDLALVGRTGQDVGTKRRRQTAAAAVGPANIERVRKYLRKHETASQASIRKALGMNSGTASLALRALEEAGEATRTGHVIDRSPIWEVKAPAPATT